MIALIDRADPAILTEPQRSSLMNDPSRVFRGDANPAEIRSVAEKRKALPALLDNARTKLESVYGTAFFRMMRRTADDAVISLEDSRDGASQAESPRRQT